VLTLFSPSAGGLILAAAIIGAAFGMLYGIASFAITKRQRDFTSVHQVLATNYQIIVDPQLTGQARRILGEAGVAPATHWYPGTPGAPGPGGPGAGFQGQPQQQPWRPGPQGGAGGASPYGGHATPHQQPGGTQQQPGGAQQPGTPAAGGQSGTPRYGTNDGPRYGETPGTAPAPAAPAAVPLHRPDEPPRYGERVSGATPTSAPDAASGDGGGADGSAERGEGDRR